MSHAIFAWVNTQFLPQSGTFFGWQQREQEVRKLKKFENIVPFALYRPFRRSIFRKYVHIANVDGT